MLLLIFIGIFLSMNEIIQFFLGNIPQTIGIIMMFCMFAYLGFEAHKRKTDLWDAIKGPDKKLQLAEVVMALWIVLFPIMVLSNLFLGLEPSPQIVFSMDIILAVILGVKKFKDAGTAVESMKRTKTEKTETEETTESEVK
jgi:hypothetical protein